MTIEFGRWRVKPHMTNGMRCWEVWHGRSRAERYYSTLDRALLYCIEWDARNDVAGTYDLVAALKEYWRIAQAVTDACQSADTRTGTPASA